MYILYNTVNTRAMSPNQLIILRWFTILRFHLNVCESRRFVNSTRSQVACDGQMKNSFPFEIGRAPLHTETNQDASPHG